MSNGWLDWKTMTLVGLAVVAGLLGARSMITGVEGRGDQGFGSSTITPLTSDEPTTQPVTWTPPTDPRNPFEMAEGFETPVVVIDDTDTDTDTGDAPTEDLDPAEQLDPDDGDDVLDTDEP